MLVPNNMMQVIYDIDMFSEWHFDFDIDMFSEMKRLFGWHILAYLSLSWLISSHIILFVLPAEHYSFYQPNTLESLILIFNEILH
jgi:hypothetical protein